MAPIAITPPLETDTTSELTAHGIERHLSKAAPSLLKNAGTTTKTLSNDMTNVLPKAHAVSSPLADLDASLLQTTLTTSPQPVPALGSPEAASGKVCTDHMIQAKWNSASGWARPALQPFGPLSLAPTSSCLHYATECFEGMKLYRGHDGKLRLFRPQLNCNRMLVSTTRIALPAFPPAELFKLVEKLCATDGPKWLPKERAGEFLYIRPTMIGTDTAIGVQRPSEALLFIILAYIPQSLISSSAPSSAPAGLKLLASTEDTCRAWPGGFGYAKVGANYGPSLVAQGEARKRGYDQILWLFGEDAMVTEAGASNFFVVWRTRDGSVQMVTADLAGKIVLDGVTRRSVLELARSRLTSSSASASLEPIEVVERRFTMSEIVEAADEGRLIEAFVTGTAWFVAPVEAIHFRGRDLSVPMSEGSSGQYMGLLKGWLKGIMWGEEAEADHEWGYVVDEA